MMGDVSITANSLREGGMGTEELKREGCGETPDF